MRRLITTAAIIAFGICVFPHTVKARNANCGELPTYAMLKAALRDAAAQKNGGLSLPMWGTVVDRTGIVCAVAFSGDSEDSQWPGSRLISEEKAYTANAFSLNSLALSTANLYAATQPSGSMFGLQASNPVTPAVAYSGDGNNFGTEIDPMLKNRVGGINVFGGGLALYNASGEVIGGLGVSGDSSCADHNIAWRVRSAFKLDYVPAGVAADHSDMIIYDMANGKSVSGWGHPTCAGTEKDIVATLQPVEKVKQ